MKIHKKNVHFVHSFQSTKILLFLITKDLSDSPYKYFFCNKNEKCFYYIGMAINDFYLEGNKTCEKLFHPIIVCIMKHTKVF